MGLKGPSDADLRRNLERTISDLRARKEIPSDQRYSIAGMNLDGSSLLGRDDLSQNISTFANNSMILNIDGSDTQYLATIPIGTPPQNFSVIMDSGSAVFWVGSDNCTSIKGGPCGNHTFLGQKQSSSFVNTGTQWQALYGSGNASGTVVTDNVVIAGIKVNNLTFGIANQLSEEFTSDNNTDGLMGLARSSLTKLRIPTPVEAMAKRGLIPAAITSYRIPRRSDGVNDGEITFGSVFTTLITEHTSYLDSGLDESRFNHGTLVTVNSTDTGFWVAELGAVTVDGVDLRLTNRTALLDTGTTLMAASPDDVKAIHDKIPGAKQNGQGYTVPCNTTAVVALTFGGQSFPINVLELARGSATQKTGDCGSGIGASATAGNRWLVGDTFLKSVYYSTNGDTNQISLATLE
ncbi:aspartic peptidase domain-containing protein [Mycena maculata]|uniref:Aspartic peptidase domain-containing protein n=1 Tax=Mycena maculata TaxID=230809 RepID=A0AAD7HLN2_9AGAR|nr:aspartic peptidase domain-containing protein [Mycena maculata]